MLWRNMAAMATEEMLRANPIDGVSCWADAQDDPFSTHGRASVDLPQSS